MERESWLGKGHRDSPLPTLPHHRPGPLQARSQQAAHMYTRDRSWFWECLHVRETGLGLPGSWFPYGAETPVSSALLMALCGRLCPAHFTSSRWRLRAESEDSPEVTQEIGAGTAFQVCPLVSAPPGRESPLGPRPLRRPRMGVPPPAPSTTPAGGLVTPSMCEIGEGGLQRPFSPQPHPPPYPSRLAWELTGSVASLSCHQQMPEQQAWPKSQGTGQVLRPADST